MTTNPIAMRSFILVLYVIIMVLCSSLMWVTWVEMDMRIIEDIPGLLVFFLVLTVLCIISMMYLKKIPVLDNLEDAKFILQQYLEEIEG